MDNKDVELLAIWLHNSARESGQLEGMRKLIRHAAIEAADTYGSPDDDPVMAQNDDPFGARGVIARFAAHWDELEVDSKFDGMDKSDTR